MSRVTLTQEQLLEWKQLWDNGWNKFVDELLEQAQFLLIERNQDTLGSKAPPLKESPYLMFECRACSTSTAQGLWFEEDDYDLEKKKFIFKTECPNCGQKYELEED